MEYTKKLVDYAIRLDPSKLPAEVMDRGRYFLLDYLGVTIRGSIAESSQPVYKMIERLGAKGDALVIARGASSLPGYAALANGTAAHAIELDDTHNAGSIHLGVVMFSTALALPEVPADRLFTAVVAGYEVAARIAMAVKPKEHYLLGFHPTSTCGVFGAAITASLLMGLDAATTLSAIGIAGSTAAGSLEFLAEGAWTKRIHPGLAAQAGIQCAMLAAGGFRGPSTILEGRDGFLHGYSRNPNPAVLTEGLGQSFEILKTSVKPHACCRYMQGPIDSILALAREHDIQASQVRNVSVAILEAGWTLVAEPASKKYKPESVVEAQFSMPYGAAVALMDRAAGLEQFSENRIHSSDVQGLLGKIELMKHPRIEETFPAEWPALVTIQLDDGRSYEKFLRHPKGDPQNPLTWDELIAKFHSLASAVFSNERCEAIVKSVRDGDLEVLYRNIQ